MPRSPETQAQIDFETREYGYSVTAAFCPDEGESAKEKAIARDAAQGAFGGREPVVDWMEEIQTREGIYSPPSKTHVSPAEMQQRAREWSLWHSAVDEPIDPVTARPDTIAARIRAEVETRYQDLIESHGWDALEEAAKFTAPMVHGGALRNRREWFELTEKRVRSQPPPTRDDDPGRTAGVGVTDSVARAAPARGAAPKGDMVQELRDYQRTRGI